MPIYKIRGINVDFPYDAYDCQLVYMEKVMQSLQEGCNALLESPTGTGKTLCLLCATLAWRKTLGDFSLKVDEGQNCFSGSQLSDNQSTEVPKSKFPIIIYSSRTHSQLKQVIRELKTTNYRPRMGVLGSREQMCIRDDVRQLRGRAQNVACHTLCKRRKCRHHLNVSEFMKNHQDIGNDPFDIEDLVKIGRTKDACPYYISRELHKVVDILFAPYNYLIDPGNRSSLSGISWSNAVLIFDEAHNLDSICADAASFDLPSSYLTACIAEAKECIDLCIEKRALERATDKRHDPETYSILRGLLLKLEKRIAEIPIDSKELGFTRPGHYIYEFLSDLNITNETANMLIDTIENASLLLEEGITSQEGVQRQSNTACRLESIGNILKIVFRDGGKSHARFYSFHVQESQSITSDSLKGKLSRSLSWWCFNPGLAMKEFVKLGVLSIILTSGTLSPLESCAQEMNLEFPVRLENPHVVSSDQVWVGVVPSGPSGYSLNSSYRTRDSLEYKQELGNTIVNLSKIVPAGLLVFFPSYYLMDRCIECWKSMSHARSSDCITIWERICKNKQPVIEPKQSALFPNAVEDFEAKLHDRTTSGAIFFAVCRGKVSEGLDFADQTGRGVIITGMPFSMKTDPKVRLKREYLDQQAILRKKDSKDVLTGESWYVQQAARAVNQAIGRVIRHRHDYGAIFLCDERFAQQSYQCQMSYWLRPYVKCYPKFGDVVFQMTRFFREKEFSIPQKRKLTESLVTEEIKMEEQPIFTSDLLSCLSPRIKHVNSDLPSSAPSILKKKIHVQLGPIIPANRSNFSYKQNHNLSASNKREMFSITNRHGTHGSIINHDNKIVDLTSDMSDDRNLRPEDAVVHCSVKLPKRSKLINEESNCRFVASPEICCKQLLPTSCSHLEAGSFDMQRRTADLISPLISKDKESTSLAKEDSVSKFSLKKEGQNCPSSLGQEISRGSTFLAQVQEKLSGEEYKDFVSFMRALKSKTMKITSVLESIAKLFSAPGRLFLLEGFKHFVPEKYRPLYEQHLRAHVAAGDN
ncbi:regulator of telomere elongation helicase 1 homolog [Dendrobium catenatum]|nr:regulator of telomere elongation helicase 1 homolog [Dendrobium catenatum]